MMYKPEIQIGNRRRLTHKSEQLGLTILVLLLFIFHRVESTL